MGHVCVGSVHDLSMRGISAGHERVWDQYGT